MAGKEPPKKTGHDRVVEDSKRIFYRQFLAAFDADLKRMCREHDFEAVEDALHYLGGWFMRNPEALGTG